MWQRLLNLFHHNLCHSRAVIATGVDPSEDIASRSFASRRNWGQWGLDFFVDFSSSWPVYGGGEVQALAVAKSGRELVALPSSPVVVGQRDEESPGSSAVQIGQSSWWTSAARNNDDWSFLVAGHRAPGWRSSPAATARWIWLGFREHRRLQPPREQRRRSTRNQASGEDRP
ncbi:hypothetical protein J5N97_010462 [Dioscorea zingiberensis]|uniref:Uncharacterized protein n=1 Tax=Dioscorea zingiberensis TaxID=325984 RepID=A0A9D5D068_9LILI|nr:hypothetical protein J5N97_010462 [Dioscorea zingiberensis]